MDVIVASDIRDVRDCGGPSEEEPGFIPHTFVIEEIHGCCWSLFTDTHDSMVCLRPTLALADSHHDISTGENYGCVNLLLRRSQGRFFQKIIPHFNRNFIHFSHSSLIPGSLFLTYYRDGPLSSRDCTYTPTVLSFHALSLDGSCCIYTIWLLYSIYIYAMVSTVYCHCNGCGPHFSSSPVACVSCGFAVLLSDPDHNLN